MVSIARAAMPFAVLRHPACTAATTPRTGSWIRSGRQSAVVTTRAKSGRFVTSPSYSYASSRRRRGNPARDTSDSSTLSTPSPCTCLTRTTCES